MSNKLTYGIVKYQTRKVVHVVRNTGDDLAMPEINNVVEMVRERMLSRHGEQTAAVVFVQGNTKETLRLFGDCMLSRWSAPRCSTLPCAGRRSRSIERTLAI
jgi:hypothetical protein